MDEKRRGDVFGFVRESSDAASPRPRTWPTSDAIVPLTRRIGELEARIRGLEAELEEERRARLARAETTRSMHDALADIQSTLESIRHEQHKLSEEVATLRAGALGAVLPASEPPIAFPVPGAADDRNALLAGLFAHIEAPAEIAVARDTVAHPAPILAPPITDAAHAVAPDAGVLQLQVIVSPIHSFPRLLEIEERIRAIATVSALYLRDFRGGVATFGVSVSQAISAAEFGTVIQMTTSLDLSLEGSTQSSVELRVGSDTPSE